MYMLVACIQVAPLFESSIALPSLLIRPPLYMPHALIFCVLIIGDVPGTLLEEGMGEDLTGMQLLLPTDLGWSNYDVM